MRYEEAKFEIILIEEDVIMKLSVGGDENGSGDAGDGEDFDWGTDW